MPPRVRIFFAALTVVFFLIPAIALYSELSKRADIWWTPPSMMVPLADATAVLFLLLVTGRLAYRGEKEAVAV